MPNEKNRVRLFLGDVRTFIAILAAIVTALAYFINSQTDKKIVPAVQAIEYHVTNEEIHTPVSKLMTKAECEALKEQVTENTELKLEAAVAPMQQQLESNTHVLRRIERKLDNLNHGE